MEELLNALKSQDVNKVHILANELFLTRQGIVNKVMVDVFKKYAPCRFSLVTEDDGSMVMGKIIYSDFPPFIFG